MNTECLSALITKKFTWDEDKALGHRGLQPMWMPNGTPTPRSEIAAHDVLEHIVDTQGGAEGELQARGMQIWGRGLTGWYNKEDRNGFPCWPGFLAVDISWIIFNVVNGTETMNEVRGHVSCTPIDADITYTLEHAMSAAAMHLNTTEKLMREKLPADVIDRMHAWIRQGYWAGKQYYEFYGVLNTTYSDLFDELVEELDNACGDGCLCIGQELTVEVNLIERSVCVKVAA